MIKENRKILVAAGIVVLLFTAVVVLYVSVKNIQTRLVLMESLYSGMSSDRAVLVSMAEGTKALKARAEESRNRNFVSAMEKTSTDFGLSKSMKKINFVTHRQDGQFSADDYELRIEGIDLNTAVNFIYRISNAGVLIKIRKCSIAVSFENPDLLTISLLVSHLK